MVRGVFVWTFVLGVFVFSSVISSGLEFNGTIYDINGNALNNSLVNVTIRDMSGWTIVGYNSTYSNASGWFNLTMPTNSSWMYEPKMTYMNNSVVEYIGQSLPAFPYQMIEQVSGTNFFLREAGTINITAVNKTGSPITFNYQVKDKKLGYVIAGNMQDMGSGGVSEAVVYVPRDRNYSLMLFPNASMPATYDWTNFSSSSDYSFDNGLSSFNSTTHTLQKRFNMTMGWGRVSGYIKVDGVAGWDEFTVVPYMLEPGNMVHYKFGSLPYNLSSYFENNSDVYNLSTGITNYSGFYNISLPSTVELSEMILFAVARNGSDYYGGFHNLSLDYATYTGGQNLSLNFTYMFGLLGSAGNISMEDPMTMQSVNVSAKLQDFNLINESNVSLSNVYAHIESTVDYTAYGVKSFTWMSDVEQGASASFPIPLLNVTGIEEMNVFVEAGDYAPKRLSWTVSEIVANNNITIGSFNPEDLSGTNGKGSANIKIFLYTSNSTCDVPNPPSSCLIGGSSEGMDTFNPMKAIMGGGKLSFRMGVGSVLIHYVNVDMLASGPPDALFQDNSAVTETTSGSFGKAMRFGSNGPTIYDYVLISIPYTEGSSSVAGLNESESVTMNISKFYDEDSNVIWNTANNGTNGTLLGGNYSHYSTYASEWEILMQGVTCLTSTNGFNSTTPCYVDTTNNRVWVRIPHFSDVEAPISGGVTSTSGGGSPEPGGSGGGSGGGELLSYNPSKLSLRNGYDITLRKDYNVKMDLAEGIHTLRLINITGGVAWVNISSDPIVLGLKENETKKVDVDSDGYYDLSIFLKSLTTLKARFVLTSIENSTGNVVPPPASGGPTTGDEKKDTVSEKDSGSEAKPRSRTWLKVVSIIFVVIAIGGWIFFFFWRKRKKARARVQEKGNVQEDQRIRESGSNKKNKTS